MVESLGADYLVVGAGAAGMAFTDALTEHADVTVLIVDRRHAPGGHWLDAYPFVRLHQASSFYGVASTLLGDGRLQPAGPEAGMHERATAPEICAYYTRVMQRMLRTGKVTYYPGCDYLGDGRFVSRLSGRRYEVRGRPRVVDARYLSPGIPATTPPPFDVAAGARVVPVNELARLDRAPSQYVVVGAGKTAADACVWLLGNGVDPDDICWVRPREPWMLDRAAVQPDPAVFLGTAADIVQAAEVATSADDLFLRMEEAGVMLRIDRSVTPTMAKIPTLGRWELDLLRTIGDVVRLGHLRRVERGRLVLDHGDVTIAPDAVVVHCAASGLRYRPLVPVWRPDVITVQPIRLGFACFGAALAGYVEATLDDDGLKNRLCPPSPFSDTPADWALQQVLGARASFGSDARVRAWSDTVSLNPARVPPELAGSAAVRAARERFRQHVGRGMARMAELAATTAPHAA
ncbi:NAD(P)-binding protein [Georgenia sp. SUBG003]|uniref:NAD(P)-binding protein n=1 Tax=Georgenia sp. SUBG003 TaxID=1497974 RepID=UPI0004D9725F|nr:pyridine nucleotide-disulfide oxidoreductase [Georgenia sp. SUBG003]